ncbi:MAG TPA: hypothetical protein GX513_02735, partial [Firmicutes bacterium]|nr:hypothetical protein [Bacillota bacterium]
MPKFLTSVDLQELAAAGTRELMLEPGTVVTSVAQEAAARLGIQLVEPGGKPASFAGGAGDRPEG